MKFVFNPLTGNLTPVPNQATEIEYDNSTSGLTATQLQDAVDELEVQIAAIPDPITYKGTWNASTNTPTLANTDTGKTGFLYQVNAAGSVDFGAGSISFEVGDKVVNNGTTWDKWDMTDAVTSVNGQAGIVVLDTDDISEGSSLYFTDERAQDAAGAMATSSSKVSLSYNDGLNTLTPDIVAGSLVNADISASAAIDATKIADGTVTSAEFQYLGGVTSDIQNQINGKQATGNYVTALTGDVTASGPGSVAATLATVNSNVGTFGSATNVSTVTVNAKGLVTAASSTAIQITESQVTNLTSDLAAKVSQIYVDNTVTKNYIPNGTFEAGNTTGWSLGTTGTLTNAIPTGSPTFGSGASGNLSISTITSGQLAGTTSLGLVSSAATTAGNMLHTDALAIDIADQAKILTAKFYYKVQSGTVDMSGTSNNSFGIAAYDVTNSSWLPVVGNFAMTQSSGVGIATATMQTNSTTASIRFVIYNANATSGAVTLYFDTLTLGPLTAPIGATATDWQSYTPTITGFGTPSGVEFEWRRVGDTAQIQGKFISGTATATEARISLPNNISSAGTDKIPTIMFAGYGVGNFTGASQYTLLIEPSVTYLTMSQQGASNAGLTKLNGSAIFGSGNQFSFRASIPIAGWSSNVQMSNDTDTRIVAAQITGNPASAAAGAVIIVPTITYDTHGAYNATTGRYTTPVTGMYKVSGFFDSSTDGVALDVYVDGSPSVRVGRTEVSGKCAFTGTVKVNAGQLLDLRTQTGGGVDAGNVYINYERLSGPSVVAATETIAASYYVSANFAASTTTPINYDTRIFDTHSAVTPSATVWKFTAPAAGIYQVSLVNMDVSPAAVVFFDLYKNGTIFQGTVAKTDPDTGYGLGGSPLIQLNAGDYIDIRPNSSKTVRGGALTESNTSVVSINRI